MTAFRYTPTLAEFPSSFVANDVYETPPRVFPSPSKLKLSDRELITGVLRLSTARKPLLDAYGRLNKLRKLKNNWNSYGAEAPNEQAIGIATEILQVLADSDAEPRVDPSSDDGVCISIRIGERYGDIEAFNDGEVLATTSHPSEEPTIWTVGDSEVDRKAALDSVLAFVYA